MTAQLEAGLQWTVYARREIERGDSAQASVALERAETALKTAIADLTRPIVGIENRTAQEVFDIMCSRIDGKLVRA
jgi:hypothetical protein